MSKKESKPRKERQVFTPEEDRLILELRARGDNQKLRELLPHRDARTVYGRWERLLKMNGLEKPKKEPKPKGQKTKKKPEKPKPLVDMARFDKAKQRLDEVCQQLETISGFDKAFDELVAERNQLTITLNSFLKDDNVYAYRLRPICEKCKKSKEDKQLKESE